MSGVEVSIEALNECQIQEVTLDGQEIYVQPLSMSDSLSKLAHKIDFHRDECEVKGKPTSEADKEEEEEPPAKNAAFQQSLWPWDSMRTKLKMALTETSVLLDVLKVVKEKHYMVLDSVSIDQPEAKPGFFAVAKKRALNSAVSILSNGAERLRKSQEQAAKRTTPNFHYELLKLRSKWRLKKVGTTILGDLSFKSAGSRFWQSGTFEVTKNDLMPSDFKESAPAHSVRSPLQVHIPSELESVAYIQVSIRHTQEGCEDLASADLQLPNSLPGSIPPDTPWQRRLETAQNVIFCKEVFVQLAREAVQVKSSLPHLVIGNQVFSHLFPGMQLCIALCHSIDKTRQSSIRPGPKPDHNQVLEHSLHQLVRELHFKNSYHPMPHPVSALLGVSKKRRNAGPQAFSRTELLDMTHSESMLDQIIRQARHFVVRTRTLDILDKLSEEITDLQIASHWCNLSSALESMVKVNITFNGYETFKALFALHICVDKIRVVMKDGRVINLSYEPQELNDFILTQVAHHHICIVQALAKLMGWQLLTINSHIGVGEMEPVGNVQSIMLASPLGNRVIAVRSGPFSGVHVHVQKTPDVDTIKELHESKQVGLAEKWEMLGGPFHKVHLDKLEGRNFVNKMELLMACLSSEKTDAL